MAKRSKPKPQANREALRLAKRAQDLEAVNLPTDLAILTSGSDIEVTRQGDKRDGRKVDSDQARRLDAFAALKEGMAPGAYDAARRFERDVSVRRGENDRGRVLERVDSSGQTDRIDAMIAAAERIEAVIDRLPPRDWWLLMELIAPRIERPSWRDTVGYITGEQTPHGQAAAVRSCCVNLRDAYAAIERKAA